MEAAGPSPRPHLELVTDELETQSQTAEMENWRPVLDAYAEYLESAEPGTDYFYPLVGSFISSRAQPLGKTRLFSDSYGVSRAHPLIEAMSAHPSPKIKDIAIEFLHLAAAEDEDAGFRAAKNLVEDDERAEETLASLMDLEEGQVSIKAIKKTMDALTTHWWEKTQGYREEIDQLRQHQANNQQQADSAQNPAA